MDLSNSARGVDSRAHIVAGEPEGPQKPQTVDEIVRQKLQHLGFQVGSVAANSHDASTGYAQVSVVLLNATALAKVSWKLSDNSLNVIWRRSDGESFEHLNASEFATIVTILPPAN